MKSLIPLIMTILFALVGTSCNEDFGDKLSSKKDEQQDSGDTAQTTKTMRILSTEPEFLSSIGGTLTVVGESFSASDIISFNSSNIIVNSRTNDSEFEVTIPAIPVGNYALRVRTANGAQKVIAFEIIDPTVNAVSPGNTYTGLVGGDLITIAGDGFQNGATVTIDGSIASVLDVQKEIIFVSTPAVSSTGAKNITVTNPDTTAVTSTGGITYNSSNSGALEIASLSPYYMSTQGGTLTISGFNFDVAAQVEIGGSGVPIVSRTADTQIEVTVPAALATSIHNVKVTNPGSITDTYTGLLIVNPSITTIGPTTIDGLTGGAAVSITGDGFQVGATVTVGGTAATVTSVSKSVITFTAPAQVEIGAKTVVVTNPDTSSATEVGALMYTVSSSTLSLSSVTPDFLSEQGGTVTVSGTSFDADAKIFINSIEQIVTSRTGTTDLDFFIFPSDFVAGDYSLEVVNPDDGENVSYASQFEIVNPVINSVTPSVIPTLAGGTVISLIGDGFQDGAKIFINGVEASVSFVSQTLIQFAAPTVTSYGVKDISIVNLDTTTDLETSGIRYGEIPAIISDVNPKVYATKGNETMTITGSNFQPGAVVRIGGATVPTGNVNSLTGTSIVLDTPTTVADGTYSVYVTNPYSADAEFASITVQGPNISYVTPAFESGLTGGNTLEIYGARLDTGATITIGGIAATVQSQIGSSVITVTTPAQASKGYKDIIVTNLDGSTYTKVAAYNYGDVWQINSSVTYATASSTYENYNVEVLSGGSLTIDGAHTFSSLTVRAGGAVYAKNIDGYTNNFNWYPLELTLGNLTVDTGGTISTNAAGYAAANRHSSNYYEGYYKDNIKTGGSSRLCGGSYGGRGGCDLRQNLSSLPASQLGAAYGSFSNPVYPGSGGGSNYGSSSRRSGDGGGLVNFNVSGDVVINGTISSNGWYPNYNVHSLSGGSGGGIKILADTISGTGTVQANGGDGATNFGWNDRYAGAGGGGRVSLVATTSFTYTGAIEAEPGQLSNSITALENYGEGHRQYYIAEPGSIFVDAPDISSITIEHGNFENGNITLSNYLTQKSLTKITITEDMRIQNGLSFPGITHIEVTGGDNSFLDASFPNLEEIKIENGSNLTIGPNASFLTTTDLIVDGSFIYIDGEHTFGDITLINSGVISQPRGRLDLDSGTEVVHSTHIIANNISIGSGSKITVSGKGYPGANAFGNTSDTYGYSAKSPFSSSGNGARLNGGGAHAGKGGVDNNAGTYGSLTTPITAGGGGGAYNAYQQIGASGGGILKITVNTSLVNNGEIASNGDGGYPAFYSGSNRYASSGGAGGSVWIAGTGAFTGSGIVSANGGDGVSRTGSITQQYSGGGGGGGRIAITITTNSFSGPISCKGGSNGANLSPYSQPGSIYVQSSTGDLNVASGQFEVGNATLDQLSNYDMTLTGSFSTANGMTVNTISSITINDGQSHVLDGTYDNLTTLTINGGSNIELLGTYNHLTDIIINNGSNISLNGTFPLLANLTVNGGDDIHIETSISAPSLANMTMNAGASTLVYFRGNLPGLTTLSATGVMTTYLYETAALVNPTLDVTLSGAGNMYINGDHTFQDVDINTSSKLYTFQTTSTSEKSMNLTVRNLVLDSSSIISADYAGYLGAVRHGGSDYFGQTGVPNLVTGGSSYICGASHGGLGECHGRSHYEAPSIGSIVGSYSNVTTMGKGGGSTTTSSSYPGGDGGGLIRVTASDTLDIEGDISALGQTTSNNYGSGGAGGGIHLEADIITGSGSTGSVTASGGNSNTTYQYYTAAGGGGRIAMIATTTFDFDGFVDASGGKSSSASQFSSDYMLAEPGSIYVSAPDISSVNIKGIKVEAGNPTLQNYITDKSITNLSVVDAWIIESGVTITGLTTVDYTSGSRGSVLDGAFTGITQLGASSGGHVKMTENASAPLTADLVISGATFSVYGDHTFADITLNGSAKLTQPHAREQIGGSFLEHYKTNLTFDNMSIDGTSSVDVTSKGLPGSNLFGNNDTEYGQHLLTPLSSPGNASRDLAGGSHGGKSAGYASDDRGGLYGSLVAPITPGSGASADSASYRVGASGGGVIKLIANTSLLNNGSIKADGMTPTYNDYYYGNSASAGAGGSIWLTGAGILSGSGSITANGGTAKAINAATDHAGGAGGRISLTMGSSTFSGSFNVAAGASEAGIAYKAEPGTFYSSLSLIGTSFESGNFDSTNNTLNQYTNYDLEITGAFIIDPSLIVTGVRTIDVQGGGHTNIDATWSNVTDITVSGGEDIDISGTFPAATNLDISGGTNITITSSAVLSSLTTLNISGGTTIVFEDGADLSSLQTINFTGVGSTTATIKTSGMTSLVAINQSAGSLYIASTVALNNPTLDFTLSSSSTYIDGTHTFRDINLTSSHTLYTYNTTATAAYSFTLNIEDLSIDATSRLNADSRGYQGASGHSGGDYWGSIGVPNIVSNGSKYNCGGSHGGRGECHFRINNDSRRGISYGTYNNITTLGGGGGSSSASTNYPGGDGGGLMRVIASGVIDINGSISANGESVTNNYGSGGAGGGVHLQADTISGSGTNAIVSANGGSANTNGSYYVAAGGGGRVAMIATTAFTYTGKVDARGGNASSASNSSKSYKDPEPGSIYLNGTGISGATLLGMRLESGNTTISDYMTEAATTTLTIDDSMVIDSGVSLGSITVINIDGGNFTKLDGSFAGLTSISIADGKQAKIGVNFTAPAATDLAVEGVLYIDGTHEFDQIDLTNGGAISQTNTNVVFSLATVEEVKTYLTGADISICASCSISVNQKGYPGATTYGLTGSDGKGMSGISPYSTSGNAAYYHSGGSYGGKGGRYSSGYSGFTYGSASEPDHPGGGGAGSAYSTTTYSGGTGGGVIKLIVTNTLTNDGVISSNGGNGYLYSGGGAGGTVFLEGSSSATLSGSGSINAIGGNGATSSYGRGGGGRIAIKNFSTISGTLSVDASRASSGGTSTSDSYGTVCVENTTSGFGTLSITGTAASCSDY